MLFEVFLQLAALATAVEIKHKPDSAYTFSCDTPVPYLANGTKATSWAQYLDETGNNPDSNGQGAVDHFAGPAGKAPLKWPRNSENKAVIPYCYLDESDRNRLHGVIEAAIHNWMTYIGPPGKEAGHAISFEEHLDNNGHPMYCFGNSKTDTDTWNSALPHETLAIMVEKDTGGWQASVGLHPDQSMPWANRLMGPGKGDLYDFAAMHELGHVMGMTHEHQRADRDKYIVVVPEKIDGFEECYQRAHQKDP